MARQLRIQYKGAVYHVTCRGNEKRKIFQDNKDQRVFLKYLRESLGIYKITLYCFILMKNHFHLLLETPLGNLSEFMRRFNITYTSYFNRKNQRVGHLYQGRYKSILVDKESYLNVLSRYIHLNPVKIKQFNELSLDKKEEHLKKYKWSSLSGYIDENKQEKFIDYEMILEKYGGNTPKGREFYWRTIKDDLKKEMNIKDKIIGGDVLGNDDFILMIKEKYLSNKPREIPSIRKIQRYQSKEKIIQVVHKETRIELEELKHILGTMRHMLMELLYKYGGMKGEEIAEMMNLDYSTVSVGRKRFRENLKKDKELMDLFERIEKKLSIIKI